MGRRSDLIGAIEATGSTFAYGTITVTDVAVAIPTTNLPNRKAITIFNMSKNADEIVYIGNSAVTTANGYPLQPSQGLPFDLSDGAKIYGIAEAGQSISVRWLEIDNS